MRSLFRRRKGIHLLGCRVVILRIWGLQGRQNKDNHTCEGQQSSSPLADLLRCNSHLKPYLSRSLSS